MDRRARADAHRRDRRAAGPAAPRRLLLGRRLAVQRAVPPRRRRRSRPTSSTPRPASCTTPSATGCGSTTSPSAARTSSPSCMDLRRAARSSDPIDGFAIIEHLRSRYEALWRELTDLEEFGADEMWRIERRVERLNDLGFDVDELDIVTDLGGDTIRIQPKVVDLGHHTRELQRPHRHDRRGQPGPPHAQRPRVVHRPLRPRPRGPPRSWRAAGCTRSSSRSWR